MGSVPKIPYYSSTNISSISDTEHVVSPKFKMLNKIMDNYSYLNSN